jgi:hypothetical protein
MKKILLKSRVLTTILFFTVFLLGNTVFGQTTGDYRSVGTGNWTTPSSWEYYNGTGWIASTSYPGQNAGTGAVSIRNSHVITINNNITNSFTSLIIGDGSSGKLIVNGDITVNTNRVTINSNGLMSFVGSSTITFPVNTSFVVNGGRLVSESNPCSNNTALYIGSAKISACNGNGGGALSNFDTFNARGGTGSVTSNSPVCNGNTLTFTATPPTATTGSYTYEYKWLGNGISTGYSSSPTYSTTANYNNHGGTYTVDIRRNDGVVSTVSTDVVINQTPVGGNVVFYNPTTICLNSPTGNMTLQNYTGQVLRWEKRLNGAASWTSIPNTANITTYSDTPSVAGTWEYRAVVGNGSCSEAFSSSKSFDVPNLTITLVSNNASGCQNNSNTLFSYTATTGNANRVYIDFDSAAAAAGIQQHQDFGVSSGGGTITIQYTWGTAPGVYNGVITVVKDNPFCKSSTTYPVTVTISSSTAPISISNQPSNKSICAGANTSFSVVTSGVSYRWQVSTNGGANYSNLSNGGVYSNVTTATMNITSATAAMNNYMYRCVISGCSTPTTSNAGILTINANGSIASVTGSASVCIGASTAYTANSVVLGGGTGLWSSSNTGVATVNASGNVTGVSVGTADIIYTIMGGCGGTKSAFRSINVNPNLPASVSIAASPSGTICLGTSVTFTATTTNPGTTPIYQWKVNGVNTGTNSSTFTTAALANNDIVTVVMTSNASPCLTGSPATSNSLTMSVNPTSSAPTVGAITNISCTISTGSVVLSGLPSGNWTITSTPAITPVTGSGPDTTISGLAAGSYTFTVTNSSGCPSAATSAVVISNNSVTTWNGSSWSHGDPDASKSVIITSAVPSTYTFSADFAACALTIDSNITARVNSGITLTITNGLTVTTGSSLTFENNASLVQINDVQNTGSITYKRNSQPMKNFDYSYWSSPVTGQTTVNLSPNTLADKYHRYDPVQGWVLDRGIMQPGIGYIIRVPKPNFWPIPTASSYIQPVEFKGIPNNGEIPVTIADGNFYLIGNPYPSALDADKFLYKNIDNADNDINDSILGGTIYFWTHNTGIKQEGSKYVYVSDDYAAYNKTGSVKANSGGERPEGYIAAGQSFFASAEGGSGTVKFTNKMRIGNNNTQFFKPSKTSKSAVTEKHRLWLNMSNAGGAFKQTLIGYVEGATNTYDKKFDGLSFDGNSYIDFYSVNEADKLTIQARALPFSDTDVVPLGYRSTIAGDFTIAIDQADGNLASQRIYLEDKQTGTINELTAGNYTFTTKAGTFNNRFVLRYTNKTLGMGDFETQDDAVWVMIQNKTITVNSTIENIDKVFIYDVSGKQLYQKEDVKNLQLIMQNLPFAQQVVLVKVVLDNGYQTTRKLIFK